MKLTKKYCAECGGEIVLSYSRETVTFCINNEGKLVYDDNVIDGEDLILHCSNDREHEVGPPKDTRLYKLYDQWADAVIDQFEKLYREDRY